MASEDSETALGGGSSSDNAGASPNLAEKDNEEDGCCLKKKRKRSSISSHQLKKLEETFKGEQWPCREKKERLAEDIGMPTQFVNIWFQNKRARIKNEFLDERDLTIPSPPITPNLTSPSSTIQVQSKSLPNLRSKANEVPSSKNPIASTSGLSLLKESNKRTSAQKHFQKEVGSQRTQDHKSRQNVPPKQPEMTSIHSDDFEDWQQEVPSTVSLFQCIIDMMAVEEGVLGSNTQPRFNDAVNDALYGVYLKDGSVLTYSTEKGLQFI